MILHTKTTGRKGFTLIELLVVIAIIAILAAILFPVFAKARDKARATACLNNMKQLNLAIQMYIGDWDGFFPRATGEWGVFPSPAPDIESGLLPFVENNYALFRCPTDNLPRGGYHACTYGFCYMNTGDGTGVYGLDGFHRSGESANIDDIHAPANYIVLTEISDWVLEDMAVDTGRASVEGADYVAYGATSLLASGWTAAFRHAGEEIGNMAFADGHAKALSCNLPCTAYNPRFAWCCELAGMYTLFRDGPRG